MATVMAKDLRLADVVKLLDGPFGTAVVTKVGETEVTFFRPYATTADFSYTGGVIPYIGIEQFSRPRNGEHYEVFQRKELT